MIVLYWMSPDPIVAREEMTLLDVRQLMLDHHIRRMPVVTDDGELCGMIGRSDLYRWVRPDALLDPVLGEDDHRELAARRVGDEMTADPHTCDAHDHIEEVCYRMSKEKIGAYPVLSRGHLVGIISESDLMRAIAELSWRNGGGKRITIRIDREHDDLLYHIVDLSRRAQLRLLSVLTHPILDESAIMATLRVEGPQVDKFVRALWDARYTVVDVQAASPFEAPDGAPE